ncbi:MAG: hypothetical protein LUH22_16270 [Bacteroides sp.]|nr:hypothetical protein [Bacteroides sp.]
MPLLDTQNYNKVIEVGKKAFEALRSDDIHHFKAYSEEAWDQFPAPRESWNQVYNYAKMVFKGFLEKKKFEEAKLWLNRMIDNNNCLHLFDSDLEFNIGKFYFETGDYQKAYEEWKIVVEDAGYRYFENEKPEYSAFYNNPQKYIDKREGNI